MEKIVKMALTLVTLPLVPDMSISYVKVPAASTAYAGNGLKKVLSHLIAPLAITAVFLRMDKIAPLPAVSVTNTDGSSNTYTPLAKVSGVLHKAGVVTWLPVKASLGRTIDGPSTHVIPCGLVLLRRII